jgi:drug/metabolite transporter (DMT)-like permease
MNTGILAAFATLLCWTIGTFAFTLASQRANPAAVNRVRLVFAALLLLLVVTIFYHISLVAIFTIPTLAQWFWLGLSGVIGLTLGDYFAFTAYSILGSSKTSLFSTFAPVAALVLGIMMLNETINLYGIIGMSISTSGIIWFVLATQKEAAQQHNKQLILKGIAFAILGAVGQGLGLVCAKKGLMLPTNTGGPISAVHATWIRMSVGAIIAYVSVLFSTNIIAEFKSITSNAYKLKPLLLGTLFGPVIGVSLSLLAATHLPVGLAQTIFSLLPITVMLAAVLAKREQVNYTALVAAAICILGVLVLVWRNELQQLISL